MATLSGARARVRALKGEEPVTVEFAAGTYRVHEAVRFTEADSGTLAAPIVYRAAPGAEVRLTGGVEVQGWRSVSDPDILERLPPETRDHVQVADLRAQDLTAFGEIPVRGLGMGGSGPAEMELFAGDQAMTLARWPNEGFRGIVDTDEDNAEVVLDTDRAARWTDETDPWILAYWHHDWSELYEPIWQIDPERNVIRRDPNVRTRYGITPGRARWYAFNLLSELDQPGEYYLDRVDGKIYFWPPEPGISAEVSMADGLIRATDLSHVTFQGFTIEAFRATALEFSGGTAVKVVGCTIRNTGRRAVAFDGGTRHEVYGCDIYYTGVGGILMVGGDRPTLTPGKHNVENNHLHRFSRRYRTYRAAIDIQGVGNRMAHNLVHHGPHLALRAPGNDHIVEFNEIHNVVYESGDAGAYYVGRDWTQQGNILRYNYWHQIVGAAGYGGMTIYLDDQHSGHTIHGNVFERCSHAVFIGGGSDNTVTDNVFIDSWQAAWLDNRGLTWQRASTADSRFGLRSSLRAVPFREEPWTSRFPNIATIVDEHPGVPKRNVFRRNISAGGLWDSIHTDIRHLTTIEDNLVFDEDRDWIQLVRDDHGKPIDIVFRDADAVAAIGFKPIPVARMGLYEDPRRASWPVKREVELVQLPLTGSRNPHPSQPLILAHADDLSWVDARATRFDEWPGLSVELSETPSRQPIEGQAPTARIARDDDRLLVTVLIPAPVDELRLGNVWGQYDGLEVCIRDKQDTVVGRRPPTFAFRGFADGVFRGEVPPHEWGNEPRVRQAGEEVEYKAYMDSAGTFWTARFAIPLDALDISPTPGTELWFNIGVRRTTGGGDWIALAGTGGPNHQVENAATIILE